MWRDPVRDDEYNQLQQERLQMLEQAFERAYTGFATEDDWAVLRYECGLSALAKGKTNASYCER